MPSAVSWELKSTYWQSATASFEKRTKARRSNSSTKTNLHRTSFYGYQTSRGFKPRSPVEEFFRSLLGPHVQRLFRSLGHSSPAPSPAFPMALDHRQCTFPGHRIVGSRLIASGKPRLGQARAADA